MTVRPTAVARPRFSTFLRSSRSSSSLRRNSYSCSWKSSMTPPGVESSILGRCRVSCNRVKSAMQGGDRDFTKWQPWCTTGEWLRCALHAHTTESDGELAPDLLAAHSSAGPVLHDVTREGEHVEVRCSPCRSIVLVAGKSIGAAVNAGRLGYVHRG